MCDDVTLVGTWNACNMVNLGRCNPHKFKLFGVLNNFLECKGVLRPHSLRTTVIDRDWGVGGNL